jgi:hypothetical protein
LCVLRMERQSATGSENDRIVGSDYRRAAATVGDLGVAS